MKICVVIPSYNESKEISNIVSQIKTLGHAVVIVDDGSSDDTAQIAEAGGAVVLRNQSNLGKGASLIKGFDYALGGDFEAVVAMDGDGQHLTEDISRFIAQAKSSEAALFVGNRMGQAKSMPMVRYLTNAFMSWLISELIRQRVPDTQCGFRLIKIWLLRRLKLTTTNYEIESEMLIKASRLGAKIESVPIHAIYRGAKSQINPFVDTVRFVIFLAREIWILRS